MEITKQKNDSKCALRLNGDMTIYTATENKVHFDPFLYSEQDITLDMLSVNEFDSSGFQMLLILERQALENDNTFRITKASPAVQEVLTLYYKKDWM